MLLSTCHMAMNVYDDLTHAFLQTSCCSAVVIAVLRLRLRNHQLNERRLLLVLVLICCCIIFVLISRIVVFKVRPDRVTCSSILIVLLFLLILLIWWRVITASILLWCRTFLFSLGLWFRQFSSWKGTAIVWIVILFAFMMVVMVMRHDVGDIFANLTLEVRWKVHDFAVAVDVVLVLHCIWTMLIRIVVIVVNTLYIESVLLLVQFIVLIYNLVCIRQFMILKSIVNPTVCLVIPSQKPRHRHLLLLLEKTRSSAILYSLMHLRCWVVHKIAHFFSEKKCSQFLVRAMMVFVSHPTAHLVWL